MMTSSPETQASGQTDIDEKIIEFDEGIPGFPELRRFVIVELHDDGAFQELRSVDDPDVAMIVTVPWLFFPEYAPSLSDAEQADLALTSAEDAVLFVPVSIADDEVTLNLLGPFVVNKKTRRGRQLVLADSDYSVKAPITLGG